MLNALTSRIVISTEGSHGIGPRDETVWFAVLSFVGILRDSGFRSETTAAGDAGYEFPTLGRSDSWPWTPDTSRSVGSGARLVENVAALRLRRVAG